MAPLLNSDSIFGQNVVFLHVIRHTHRHNTRHNVFQVICMSYGRAEAVICKSWLKLSWHDSVDSPQGLVMFTPSASIPSITPFCFHHFSSSLIKTTGSTQSLICSFVISLSAVRLAVITAACVVGQNSSCFGFEWWRTVVLLKSHTGSHCRPKSVFLL